MKSVIIYMSRHHGNTKKLVEYLVARYSITLLDAQEAEKLNTEEYDLIGFASGVDFGKFYSPVTDLAKTISPGKCIYALYTCARDQARYGSEIEEIAALTGCTYLGKYGCRGYNTYGPWKLVGGMNKEHPSEKELQDACAFYENLLRECGLSIR